MYRKAAFGRLLHWSYCIIPSLTHLKQEQEAPYHRLSKIFQGSLQ